MNNIRMPVLQTGAYEATMVSAYKRPVETPFSRYNQRVLEFAVDSPQGQITVFFYGSKNNSQYKEKAMLENILGPVNFDIDTELGKMIGEKMEIMIHIQRDAKGNFWENVVNVWPID